MSNHKEDLSRNRDVFGLRFNAKTQVDEEDEALFHIVVSKKELSAGYFVPPPDELRRMCGGPGWIHGGGFPITGWRNMNPGKFQGPTCEACLDAFVPLAEALFGIGSKHYKRAKSNIELLKRGELSQ